jgi:hypothetical protein
MVQRLSGETGRGTPQTLAAQGPCLVFCCRVREPTADGASDSAAAQANVALRDAEPEYKPPNGYRKAKTKKNGEATYCKKEQVIGTRFAKTYCYTQLQLEQLERQNAEVRRDVTRSQTQQNPVGG